MEATFGKDGELKSKTNEVKTAKGLGGVNIEGTDDKKALSENSDGSGHELKIKDTDGGEVAFDPGSNTATLSGGDPLTGNHKTAAGTVTTAGREDQN